MTTATEARRSDAFAGSGVVSRLRAVPDLTGRASSGAFALFVAGVLALGLLGLLALNTLLTQGSFASSDLGRTQAALADQEQDLRRQVAELASPASLALAARRLGMVPTTNPAFIDPRTGRVLGVPVAGRAAPRPGAAATPVASGTASPQPTAGTAAPAPTTAGATTAAAPKPAPEPTPKPSPGPTAVAR